MATKVKRPRRTVKAERDEADRVYSLLLLLEASDYRPGVESYFLADNVAATGVRAVGDSPPARSGGLILRAAAPFGRAALELVECEPVSSTKLDALRLWWHPLVGGVPDELCRVSSSVVDQDNGRVLAARRDYRHRQPDGKTSSGTAWFHFPTRGDYGAEVRRRQTSSGLGSRWETYTETTTERDGLSHSCSLAVNFIAWTEAVARAFWQVSLTCRKSGTAVRLFTDRAGVTGLYNLRDVGADGRRAALLHWVRAHTRRIAADAAAEIPGHLRGKESFRWFGFDAAIQLPTTSTANPTG
jgi:hypothetical protein